MKVVWNNIVPPFKRFFALSFCGLMFARKEYKYLEGSDMYKRLLRHESIHFEQQKELGFLLFFVIYFLEWIYRLIFHTKNAYRGISFEREAYEHQYEEDYIKNRKHFAQWTRKH